MFRKLLDVVGRRTITTAIILAFATAIALRTSQLVKMSATGGSAVVALFYDPIEAARAPEIRAAYDHFFDENGIPHRWYTFADAIELPWAQLPGDIRAIILPDRICQRIHDSFDTILEGYVHRGGEVIVVQDAGDQDRDGFYRRTGVFDPLLGIHYIRTSQNRSRAFAFGQVRFASSDAASRWSIPAGKVNDDNYLEGYGYGQLTYAINRAETYDPDVQVDATFDKSPVVATRHIGAGVATYFNLPLGALKASGDTMPMQALLRTALYTDDHIPHLVPAPGGIGHIIVNFHIDSNAEWRGIPNLIAHNLLRKDVRMEFDVTAGPDMAAIGDDQGFHACGVRGRGLLLTLAKYGTIGDHGGWAHNYFSSNLEAGRFTDAQEGALIERNTQCLESVLHQPIRSYAAPDGAHPQPDTTEILESQGIDSYYYTGDSGAPALRPFFKGKLVGKRAWAYPVLTFGTDASVQEMAVDNVSPLRAERWWKDTLDFVEAQRGIYLLYTHSYDLRVHPQYIPAFSGFLDKIEADQYQGLLHTITMPEATEFLQRFSKTTFAYREQPTALSVDLGNPDGLRDIAFAVPDAEMRKTGIPTDLLDLVAVHGGYHIFSIRTDATHIHLDL